MALILFPGIVEAQCAMCKAVAESNTANGAENAREGINNGILYLMGVPYLLLAGIGFLLFKKFKKHTPV